MAKITLTRPELKRQRDAQARYNRYLPMLKLKQQLLQSAVLSADRQHRAAEQAIREAEAAIDVYRPVLSDLSGLNVNELAQPSHVETGKINIAGVTLRVFASLTFVSLNYSLFATPPWVDQAIADLRRLSRCRIEAELLAEQAQRLRQELLRITQRVNLFEKVLIPAAREAIRVIRIRLGDEQTAAVGRAKIAKGKIQQEAAAVPVGEEARA